MTWTFLDSLFHAEANSRFQLLDSGFQGPAFLEQKFSGFHRGSGEHQTLSRIVVEDDNERSDIH